MRFTLDQIMTMVASTVNQEAESPTSGTDDYNLWIEYINRALNEWKNANDWEELKRNFTTTSVASQVSMGLPTNFDRLAGKPRISITGDPSNNDYKYVMTDPNDEYLLDSDQKYFEIYGDYSDGFYLQWNPALTSGASINILYYKCPESMSSTGQYAIMEDPLYLVDRTIAYIYESRADGRFSIEEAKARERLMNMVESGNLKKYNSYAGRKPVQSTLTKLGFRVGRD